MKVGFRLLFIEFALWMLWLSADWMLFSPLVFGLGLGVCLDLDFDLFFILLAVSYFFILVCWSVFG